MTRTRDDVLHTIHIDAGRDRIHVIHRRRSIEDNEYYADDEVCDILCNDGIDDMREHVYEEVTVQ